MSYISQWDRGNKSRQETPKPANPTRVRPQPGKGERLLSLLVARRFPGARSARCPDASHRCSGGGSIQSGCWLWHFSGAMPASFCSVARGRAGGALLAFQIAISTSLTWSTGWPLHHSDHRSPFVMKPHGANDSLCWDEKTLAANHVRVESLHGFSSDCSAAGDGR